MNPDEMKRRTKAFGLSVMQLTESLPRTRSADVIGRQLVRCAFAVGANYRSACRGKSTPDFIAKMGLVEEEADECGYWLEILSEGGIVPAERVAGLAREAGELLAIVVASIKTARKRPKQ